MKTRTLSCILSVLLLLPLAALASDPDQQDKPFSFHNGVQFDMSIDEVISIVGEPTLQNDGVLMYSDQKSAGRQASYLFAFEDGLSMIGVFFEDTHTNENLYIDDFDSVDAALTAKYGTPEFDRFFNWSDDLYEDDPNDWGFAISLGDLQIVSSWEMPDCEAIHTLRGDNYEISHLIAYSRVTDEPDKPNTDGI